MEFRRKYQTWVFCIAVKMSAREKSTIAISMPVAQISWRDFRASVWTDTKGTGRNVRIKTNAKTAKHNASPTQPVKIQRALLIATAMEASSRKSSLI